MSSLRAAKLGHSKEWCLDPKCGSSILQQEMTLTAERGTVLCLKFQWCFCSTEMILAGAYMYHEMVMGTAITQEVIDSEDLPHLHATQPDSIC